MTEHRRLKSAGATFLLLLSSLAAASQRVVLPDRQIEISTGTSRVDIVFRLSSGEAIARSLEVFSQSELPFRIHFHDRLLLLIDSTEKRNNVIVLDVEENRILGHFWMFDYLVSPRGDSMAFVPFYPRMSKRSENIRTLDFHDLGPFDDVAEVSHLVWSPPSRNSDSAIAAMNWHDSSNCLYFLTSANQMHPGEKPAYGFGMIAFEPDGSFSLEYHGLRDVLTPGTAGQLPEDHRMHPTGIEVVENRVWVQFNRGVLTAQVESLPKHPGLSCGT